MVIAGPPESRSVEWLARRDETDDANPSTGVRDVSNLVAERRRPRSTSTIFPVSEPAGNAAQPFRLPPAPLPYWTVRLNDRG